MLLNLRITSGNDLKTKLPQYSAKTMSSSLWTTEANGYLTFCVSVAFLYSVIFCFFNCDFLLKPVSKDDLLLAMNRYYLNKKNTKLPPVLPPHYPIDKPLLITTITNDKVILRPQNIGYFRYNSERKLWEIILDDFRHVILKHNTTAEVILNYGAEFIQIHKTYIININYLSMIQDSTCIMLYPFNTVTELKVSKIYKKKLLDKFYNL